MGHSSRRLVLGSLDWTRAKDPPLSLGHASIVAQLREHQFEVVPLQGSVVNPMFDPIEFASSVLEMDDGRTDFGLGMFVWNEDDAKIILDRLQDVKFGGRILLGGPQISFCEAGRLERLYPQATHFVRGYGETAVQDWVAGKERISGVHTAGQPDVAHQATTQIEALTSPILSGVLPLQPFMRWETQRGCPFSCSFCQHRDRDDDQTLQQRQRKHFARSRIASEAALLSGSHSPVQDIAVLDPIFNSGPNYFNVLDALTGYRGKLSLQCRFEMVKPEFLSACASLVNCGARVILEFGLQTAVKAESAAINRPNNLKKVERVISDLHELGLEFEVSLIYGLPLQTYESFLHSVNWCLERRVPVVKAWPLMLLRGTELERSGRKFFDLQEDIDAAELLQLQGEGLGFGRAERVLRSIPHVVSSNSFTRTEWAKMSALSAALRSTEGNHPPRFSQ